MRSRSSRLPGCLSLVRSMVVCSRYQVCTYTSRNDTRMLYRSRAAPFLWRTRSPSGSTRTSTTRLAAPAPSSMAPTCGFCRTASRLPTRSPHHWAPPPGTSGTADGIPAPPAPQRCGSYDSFTTPSVNVVAAINRIRIGSSPAWNGRTPSPQTTGCSQNLVDQTAVCEVVRELAAAVGDQVPRVLRL